MKTQHGILTHVVTASSNPLPSFTFIDNGGMKTKKVRLKFDDLRAYQRVYLTDGRFIFPVIVGASRIGGTKNPYRQFICKSDFKSRLYNNILATDDDCEYHSSSLLSKEMIDNVNSPLRIFRKIKQAAKYINTLPRKIPMLERSPVRGWVMSGFNHYSVINPLESSVLYTGEMSLTIDKDRMGKSKALPTESLTHLFEETK